jgi:hypothetical protein
MTTKKEELTNISTLTTTEAIKIFNEIFKNPDNAKVSENPIIESESKNPIESESKNPISESESKNPISESESKKKKSSVNRNEIRNFLIDNNLVIKVNKLEGDRNTPYKYQREIDNKLVVYVKIKNDKNMENKENIKIIKDMFNDVRLIFDQNMDDGDVETVAGKQDDQNLSDFEEDDKKPTKAEQAAQSQAAIEESSKGVAGIQNNPLNLYKQNQAKDNDKKAAEEKADKLTKVQAALRAKLSIKAALAESKNKPQQETKIQKFNQYKKVTRQNLTDKPKKAQVEEKTEKQVTNEVKHGMFNHEKKQEAAFQKYAQGKNHMTRFNTNMAEALKIRINQGFSPFSH